MHVGIMISIIISILIVAGFKCIEQYQSKPLSDIDRIVIEMQIFNSILEDIVKKQEEQNCGKN